MHKDKEEVINSRKEAKHYRFPNIPKKTTKTLYQPRTAKMLNQLRLNHKSTMLE